MTYELRSVAYGTSLSSGVLCVVARGRYGQQWRDGKAVTLPPLLSVFRGGEVQADTRGKLGLRFNVVSLLESVHPGSQIRPLGLLHLQARGGEGRDHAFRDCCGEARGGKGRHKGAGKGRGSRERGKQRTGGWEGRGGDGMGE